MKRLHLFCSYLACLAVLPLWAQNSTNLPTSMYGIGELSAATVDAWPAWDMWASP